MNLLEQWGWRWSSWQKGERGEYWFLAQVFGLLIFALLPRRPVMDLAELTLPIQVALAILAGMLTLFGLILIGKGLFDLGRSLTPLPYPREDGQLVTKGVYGIVRHPLYAGIVAVTLGWVLFTLSWSHGLAGLAIAVLLDRKAAQEEIWLTAKYPEYAEYRQRTKKLVPWIW
ncbi:MAG: isoprenylcysteine carboxylmethyltransferase family protein [Thermosynechococcaceae cyanobacterium]